MDGGGEQAMAFGVGVPSRDSCFSDEHDLKNDIVFGVAFLDGDFSVGKRKRMS